MKNAGSLPDKEGAGPQAHPLFRPKDQIVPALAALAGTAIMVAGLTCRFEKKLPFPAWSSMAVLMLYLSHLALRYLLRQKISCIMRRPLNCPPQQESSVCDPAGSRPFRACPPALHGDLAPVQAFLPLYLRPALPALPVLVTAVMPVPAAKPARFVIIIPVTHHPKWQKHDGEVSAGNAGAAGERKRALHEL